MDTFTLTNFGEQALLFFQQVTRVIDDVTTACQATVGMRTSFARGVLARHVVLAD